MGTCLGKGKLKLQTPTPQQDIKISSPHTPDPVKITDVKEETKLIVNTIQSLHKPQISFPKN